MSEWSGNKDGNHGNEATQNDHAPDDDNDYFSTSPPLLLFDADVIVDDYYASRRGHFKDSNDDIGLYYDEEDLKLADAEGTYKVLVAVPLDERGEVIPKARLGGGRAVRGGGTLSLQQTRRRQQREEEFAQVPFPLPLPGASRPLSTTAPTNIATIHTMNNNNTNNGTLTIASSSLPTLPPAPPDPFARPPQSNTGNDDDSPSPTSRNPLTPSSSPAAAGGEGGGERLGGGGGNTARMLMIRKSHQASRAVGGGGDQSAATDGNDNDHDAALSPANFRYEWRGGGHGGAHSRSSPAAGGGTSAEANTNFYFSPREGEGGDAGGAGGGGIGGVGHQRQLITNGEIDNTINTDANDEAALRRQLYRTCDTHWFTFSGEPADVLAFRSLIANDLFKDPPPDNLRKTRRIGPLEKGETARGRRLNALNSPFPGDILSMIFLFIPANSRRQMVSISAVCRQWRYFANYCPHWTRFRLNTFVGSFPKSAQKKLKQRKIVTRDELMLERARAMQEASTVRSSQKRGVFLKELYVFLVVFALMMLAWLFSMGVPALATRGLNNDGKIGVMIFFVMLLVTIGEYFLFFFFIDRKFFADLDKIAGVGQHNLHNIMVFRAQNDDAQQARAVQQQREVRAWARDVEDRRQTEALAAARGGRAVGGSQTVNSVSSSPLPPRSSPSAANASSPASPPAGGRVLGTKTYVNGKRVAAPNAASPTNSSKRSQPTTSIARGGGDTRQNDAVASQQQISLPNNAMPANSAAPPSAPSRSTTVSRLEEEDGGAGRGGKSSFAESSRTIRTVLPILCLFNLAATIVIGLLWGRIRAVDGLITKGEFSLVSSASSGLSMWGGNFSSASEIGAGGASSSPLVNPKAYYTLPAPLDDPRWMLVNPLVFFNDSSYYSDEENTDGSGGGSSQQFDDRHLPFIIYSYSANNTVNGGDATVPPPPSEWSSELFSRWFVNRTDFLRLVGGGNDFAVLWFDADCQSPQFGVELFESSQSDIQGSDEAFESVFETVSAALIPQWWNETFAPCAANSSLCDVNVTVNAEEREYGWGTESNASHHGQRQRSGVSSVEQVVTLLLQTVTADWLGFNPYSIISTPQADKLDQQCPLVPSDASRNVKPFNLTNSSLVAVSGGDQFFSDHLSDRAGAEDPYKLLRRQLAFGREFVLRKRRQNGNGGAVTSYAAILSANYYGTERASGQHAWWYSRDRIVEGEAPLYSLRSGGGVSVVADSSVAVVEEKGTAIASPYRAFRDCARQTAADEGGGDATSSSSITPFIPLIRFDIPNQDIAFAEARRTRLLVGHFVLVLAFVVCAAAVFLAAVIGVHPTHVDRLGQVVAVVIGIVFLNPVTLIAFGSVCIHQSIADPKPSWANDPPPITATEAPFMCDKVGGGAMVAVGLLIIIVASLAYVKRKCQEM